MLFPQVSADGRLGLLPVLVCMQILTLPSLGSWIKGLIGYIYMYIANKLCAAYLATAFNCEFFKYHLSG